MILSISPPGAYERRCSFQYTSRSANITYVLVSIASLFLFMFLASLIFMALEKEQSWNLRDAWYFSVITLSTVGYGVLTPSTDTTRIFVMLYLIFGVVYFIFTISLLTEYLLQKMMDAMKEVSLDNEDEVGSPTPPATSRGTVD